MRDTFEFTVDWFSHFEPFWRFMIGDVKPRRALEIGSFEGRSAVFLLEQCAAFGPLDLTCIDTWAGGAEHAGFDMAAVEARFDRNIAHATAAYGGAVRKLKSASVQALARLVADGAGGQFDFIYIDGSHQAADVLADAVLAFALLRVGGVLAFDDYLWDGPGQARLQSPKFAIDAFVNTYLGKAKIIKGAPLVQIYIAKTAH